jgi:hypothetical protein
MSTFTRFSAIEQLQYDKSMSVLNNKDLWAVIPGFRYYIGSEGSDKYVDVETGFRTDGATIPRFLWWILPPMGEYSQACTLHDKLCQTYRITQVINGVPTQVPVTRKEIDEILKEAMDVLEVVAWKKFFINCGVDGYRIATNPTVPKAGYLVA